MHEPLIEKYWLTLRGDQPEERLAVAQEILNSSVSKIAQVAVSALCVLLDHGHVDDARAYLEQEIYDRFDESYRTLLPLLGHVYQRQFDFVNAHLVFSACRQLNLFTGRNQWAEHEARQVAFGLAEHLYYAELEQKSLHAIGIRSRVLNELALDPLPDPAGSGANRLPDFMIVGSAKCGTTFLYDLACKSAGVWQRVPKEIHFFTNLYNFGAPFYSRYFANCPAGLVCGEASPDYFDVCNPALDNYVDAAGRIHEVAPDTRFVIVLRDPAVRAVSLYNQLVTNKESSGPRSGMRKLADLTLEDLACLNGGYALKSGHYIVPLRRFAELFGRERMLVLAFDELVDRSAVAAKLCRFLGVASPEESALGNVATNAGGHSQPSAALYRELRAHYADSLAELADEYRIVL